MDKLKKLTKEKRLKQKVPSRASNKPAASVSAKGQSSEEDYEDK